LAVQQHASRYCRIGAARKRARRVGEDMGSLAVGKVRAMLDAGLAAAIAHPAVFAVYMALLLGAVVAALVLVWRRRPQAALWCVAAAVMVDLFFYTGDDTSTHVYRIVALADQVRAGALSPLLVDPTSGDAVPTFVYYSALPYALPVLLDLVGVPALFAFKLAMMTYLAVLVGGLQALVGRLKVESGFLAAMLFVSANYVAALWFARAAIAEVWVYGLMPWVVLSSLDRRSGRWLALGLFLQICGHPVILAQALVAEIVVAWALAGIGPVALARRWLVPALAAVALAVPFWLPQALAQSLILGPQALPSRFVDSFFSLAELVRLQNLRTVGLWLPLAVLLLAVAARARLPRQFWIPAALALALTALQARVLFAVTSRLPMLELSLFVWRLALPVAFLLLGALLAGRRIAATGTYRALAAVAAVSMAFVMLQFPPNLMDGLARGWHDDRRMLVEFGRSDIVWGTREYLPNYKAVRQACDTGTAQRASYAQLRDGLEATAPFVRVPNGPVGLVDYRINGVAVVPTACDGDLVLGPLPPAVRITVSETRLDWLTFARAAGLVTAVMLILWAIPFSALAGRAQPH
jgi:hypothetical protein